MKTKKLFIALFIPVALFLGCGGEEIDLSNVGPGSGPDTYPNIKIGGNSNTGIDGNVYYYLDLGRIGATYIYQRGFGPDSTHIEYDTMIVLDSKRGSWDGQSIFGSSSTKYHGVVVYHSHPSFRFQTDPTRLQHFRYIGGGLEVCSGSADDTLERQVEYTDDLIDWGVVFSKPYTFLDSAEFELAGEEYLTYYRPTEVKNNGKKTDLWIIPKVGISDMILKDGSHWKLIEHIP